jgi:hypothetical protein
MSQVPGGGRPGPVCVPYEEGQLLMKKFVALTFLFVSLCVAGCSGEKKATEVKKGPESTTTKITDSK